MALIKKTLPHCKGCGRENKCSKIEAVGIAAGTQVLIQGIQAGHLFLRQFEIKQLSVGGDIHDDGVGQHGTVLASQRAVGLVYHAVLLTQVDEWLLGQIRVDLKLIDHGHNPGRILQLLQVLAVIVAYTDGTDLSRLIQLLQHLPGLNMLVYRPVNQVEIQVIGTETVQRFREGLLTAALAYIVVPQLGGNKQLLSGQTAGTDSLLSLP